MMVATRDQHSLDPDDDAPSPPLNQSDTEDEFDIERALTDRNVDKLSEIVERAAISDENGNVLNNALLLSPACANGCVDVMRFLLSRGADCNVCTESEGESVWPVLQLVVVRSDLLCLQLLLECENIDKDVVSRSGQTALMIAGSNAFLPGVRLLLDSGCDVDKANPINPSTAIHWCFGLSVPFRTNCYSRLETFEQFRCFECLVVKGGADINSRDKLGFAPIHYAVRINHIEAVKLLISENCDLNATGTFETGTFDPGSVVEGVPVTPFLLAVHYGHAKVARLLVDSGCEFYQSAHVLKSLNDNPDFSWLSEEFTVPRKLREMSRINLRRSFGRGIRRSIEHLPIPLLHKQNLLLYDVLVCEVHSIPINSVSIQV